MLGVGGLEPSLSKGKSATSLEASHSLRVFMSSEILFFEFLFNFYFKI
jgi:heme/copper-type cytochrome/quinol oxidase subunit 3